MPIVWILVLCVSVGWVCLLVGFVMGCEWAARVRDEQAAEAALFPPAAADPVTPRTLLLVDGRLREPATLN